jgi:hypothetical protein
MLEVVFNLRDHILPTLLNPKTHLLHPEMFMYLLLFLSFYLPPQVTSITLILINYPTSYTEVPVMWKWKFIYTFYFILFFFHCPALYIMLCTFRIYVGLFVCGRVEYVCEVETRTGRAFGVFGFVMIFEGFNVE